MIKSDIDKLLIKAEKLFNLILKKCSNKDGTLNAEELSLIVDRIKFLKDRILLLLDSEKITESKIKELLERFKSEEADYIG